MDHCNAPRPHLQEIRETPAATTRHLAARSSGKARDSRGKGTGANTKMQPYRFTATRRAIPIAKRLVRLG
jgi:hypothetical protein